MSPLIISGIGILCAVGAMINWWVFRCDHIWETGTLSTQERVRLCSACQKTEYICPAHPYGPQKASFIPGVTCVCPRQPITFTPDEERI